MLFYYYFICYCFQHVFFFRVICLLSLVWMTVLYNEAGTGKCELESVVTEQSRLVIRLPTY